MNTGFPPPVVGIKLPSLSRQFFLGVFVGLLTFGLYWMHVDRVPFHRDEASWLHTSRDGDLIAKGDIWSLVWRSEGPLDDDTALRMLNAPVPKHAMRISTAGP
jgi:hypothetical protein